MSPGSRMMFIAAAMLLAGAASSSAAQNSGQTTANAAVNVTLGISLQKNADLVFGDIVQPPVAGTVVMSPAGVRTSATLIFGNGPFNAASFAVARNGGGNPHYTITLPASVTITSGANSMTVDTFTSNPAGGGFAQPTDTLTVGATLHVGASQPFGTYTGVFSVTVVQQ